MIALLLSACALGGGRFTATNGSVPSVNSEPVPGFTGGVVPWELDEDQVVRIRTKPDAELAPGDGKMTLALTAVPFRTPERAAGARGASALADGKDYYYSERVQPSEVQGVTFCPGESAPAFACYDMDAPAGGTGTVGLAWYSMPESLDAYYIGIGDPASRCWHWYSGPADGVLTFDSKVWDTPLAPGGKVLICVLLRNGKPADFWQLKAGVPEVRGTGIVARDNSRFPAVPRSASKIASGLPARADLKPFAPPIHDQGAMGSCTAFGTTDAAFNILLNEMYGAQGWNPALSANQASPMWNYIKSGTPPIGYWHPACGASVGRYMYQPFTALKDAGSAIEQTVPYYATEDCSGALPANASEEAQLLKISDYYYLGNGGIEDLVLEIKNELAAGRPVPIAMYGLENAFLYYTSGVYHFQHTAGINAGHCMCIIGYDDELQAFEVRNSWGPFWGQQGYWWCGYDAVYALEVLGRFDAYGMTAVYNADAAAYFLGAASYDEQEPNDTAAQANALPASSFSDFSGKIGDGADNADYLQFTYVEGESTSFTLSYNPALVELELELRTSSDELIGTGSGSAGSKSISGVWNGNGSACVKVVWISGVGDYSFSGAQGTPPSSPTNLMASAGTADTGVRLSWSGVSGATTYYIERGSSPDGPFTEIGSSYAPVFLDDQVPAWKTFWYRVAASSGGGRGLPCTPVSGWRAAPPPANFSASDGTSPNSVALSWDAVAGATGYRVERAVTAQGPWQKLGDFTDTSTQDTKVSAGVHMFYRVQALLDDLAGPPSAADTGYAQAGAQPRLNPSAPQSGQVQPKQQLNPSGQGLNGSSGQKVRAR